MSPVEVAALEVGEQKLREFIAASIAGEDSEARNRLNEFVVATHVGGIPPQHALAFLRDVPAIREHFTFIKSAIDDVRDELVSERDTAPAEASGDLEFARAAYDRAVAAEKKSETDATSAREARRRAFDRVNALQLQLANRVNSRNITLELLADPALEKAIHELGAEAQAMHSRPIVLGTTTVAARFAYAKHPDKGLRRRQHAQQLELLKQVRPALESAGSPLSEDDLHLRIEAEIDAGPRYRFAGSGEPLDPPGLYAQTTSYIEGLGLACGLLAAAKTLDLGGETAAAFVERVLACIPYRDPSIAFKPRGLTRNPEPQKASR